MPPSNQINWRGFIVALASLVGFAVLIIAGFRMLHPGPSNRVGSGDYEVVVRVTSRLQPSAGGHFRAGDRPAPVSDRTVDVDVYSVTRPMKSNYGPDSLLFTPSELYGPPLRSYKAATDASGDFRIRLDAGLFLLRMGGTVPHTWCFHFGGEYLSVPEAQEVTIVLHWRCAPL